MLSPEERKREQDWARGKKRTCPRCGLIFLTRKNKRIHRRDVPECEPVKNSHSKYD